MSWMTKTLKVMVSNAPCQFQHALWQHTARGALTESLDKLCSEVFFLEVNFCHDSNLTELGMSAKGEIQTWRSDLN